MTVILRKLPRLRGTLGFGLAAVLSASAAFGQLVYVPNQTGNSVSEFTISGTGTLTPVSGQATSSTVSLPARAALTPDGKYLYITGSGGSIGAFSVSSTGALTALTTYTLSGSPLGITVDSAGHLYVADSTGSNIYAFGINASTGALTAIGGALPTGGGNPTNLVASGGYLYVALSGAGKIRAYAITGTGALGAFTEVTPGGALKDIAVAGGYVFATDFTGNQVVFYQVSGGTFGAGATEPTGTAPYGIAIDPTGSFVYTANAGAGTVSAFFFSGGVMSSRGTQSTDAGPLGVAVDPTGKYVYVSNASAGSVSQYTITPSGGTAGALTANGTATAGATPYLLVAHNAPPAAPTPTPPATPVPVASTWSLAALGILLALLSGLLYRRAYR